MGSDRRITVNGVEVDCNGAIVGDILIADQGPLLKALGIEGRSSPGSQVKVGQVVDSIAGAVMGWRGNTLEIQLAKPAAAPFTNEDAYLSPGSKFKPE